MNTPKDASPPKWVATAIAELQLLNEIIAAQNLALEQRIALEKVSVCGCCPPVSLKVKKANGKTLVLSRLKAETA